MHFPDNALPPQLAVCHVHVKASLAGEFQFPDDTDLISGVYWISCPHKFAKPVTVKIQHCATKPEYSSHLTFVVTKCTQEDLPYKFKVLEGGIFSSGSQYGVINLTQFSGFGVAYLRQSLMRWFGFRSHQPRSYCAQLYYSSSNIRCWELCFAITWNLEIHIEVSSQKQLIVAM